MGNDLFNLDIYEVSLNDYFSNTYVVQKCKCLGRLLGDGHICVNWFKHIGVLPPTHPTPELLKQKFSGVISEKKSNTEEVVLKSLEI